jgi:hypothetical protein
MNCPVCHGARWVCEDHPDRPWSDGCACGGAGAPCPACNISDFAQKPQMPEGYQSFARRTEPTARTHSHRKPFLMSHKHREEIEELPEPTPSVPPTPSIPASTTTEDKIQRLSAALKGEEWLIRQCQRVLELHLKEKINADDTVSALLRLLDGPEQRRIQEAVQKALER